MSDCKKIVEKMGREIIEKRYELIDKYNCRIGYKLNRIENEIDALIDEFSSPGVDQFVLSKNGSLGVLKERYGLPEWFDETFAEKLIPKYNEFKKIVNSVSGLEPPYRSSIIVSALLTFGYDDAISALSTLGKIPEDDVKEMIDDAKENYNSAISYFRNKQNIRNLKIMLRTFLGKEKSMILGEDVEDSINFLKNMDRKIKAELEKFDIPPIRTIYGIDRELGSLIEEYFADHDEIISEIESKREISVRAKRTVETAMNIVKKLPSNRDLVTNYDEYNIAGIMKELDNAKILLKKELQELYKDFILTAGERRVVGNALRAVVQEQKRIKTIEEFIRKYLN